MSIERRTAMLTPGDLDLSFATGGKLELVFPGSSNYLAQSVMFSASGKLMLSWANDRPKFGSVQGFYGMECLNKDGTPDTSFGEGGYVHDRFVEREDVLPSAGQQTLQMSDGHYLLFGTFKNSNNCYIPCLAMYTKEGHLDESFGQKGKFVFDDPISTGPYNSQFAWASFQSSEHIMIAYQRTFGVDDWANVLVRVTTSGHVDSTFNDNKGEAIARPSPGENCNCLGIAIQPDLKILVYGQSESGDAFIQRFESNGQIDTGFADSGVYRRPDWKINHLMVQPDEKLLLCGESENTALLVRLNADASFDQHFNEGKPNLTPLGEDSRWSKVALHNNGQIVTIGSNTPFMSGTSVLGRFQSDGKLDEGFGKGTGWVATDYGLGVSQPIDLALDMRGFIYVLGKHQGLAVQPDLLLLRYID
jgi:uncharacterized delta-60 repeat protein